jgi:DNA-binding GntR family transcriptional regulator
MTTTMIKESTPTAAALAYTKLRGDILRGVLVPLERLRVNDISERYGRR